MVGKEGVLRAGGLQQRHGRLLIDNGVISRSLEVFITLADFDISWGV